LSLLFVVVLQELNSHYLGLTAHRSGMVYTADEPSYTVPPVNFIHQGVWKDNFEGNSAFYQRPPGYGMIYGICYLVFREHSLLALRIIQLTCFLLSVVLIGWIINHHLKNEKIAWIGALFYGLLPMYSGFTAYVLSEGITPFLVLWTIYSFTLENRSKHLMIFISVAVLILVRPQLAFVPASLLVFNLIKGNFRNTLITIIAFTPFFIWQLRSIYIEGRLTGVHPIYSDTNISLYRPGHEAMTDLFRVWEHDGERFHSFTAKLLQSETSETMDMALELIPVKFRSTVKPLALEFYALLHDPTYGRTKEFKEKERSFVFKVEDLRNQLISENRFQYYVITPLNSAKFLLTKSQLNQFIFQSSFRNNPFVELLRFFCVLTIVSGVVLMFYYVVRFKAEMITVLSIAVLCYLFYLFFFQRMNEDRYLVPVLPILLLVSIHFFHDLFSDPKRIFSKNL
jgi:hypothetical protein